VRCSDSDHAVKLLVTAAAAAAANFLWYSVIAANAGITAGGPAVAVNYYNVLAMMVLGLALALPIDRLNQSVYTG